MNPMSKPRKSADERLLERYEAGEFVSTSPTKAELKKFRDAARATLVRDQRVNVRLSSELLHRLKARAVEEGLPYQTLIASVLHKFVTGRLVDRYGSPMARRAKSAPHLARVRVTRNAVRVGQGR
jgi:predicted DNA binding CopG/RHH family protein